MIRCMMATLLIDIRFTHGDVSHESSITNSFVIHL
jgi:hypothetical protein